MKTIKVSTFAVAAMLAFAGCAQKGLNVDESSVLASKVSQANAGEEIKLTSKERAALKDDLATQLPADKDELKEMISVESTQKKLVKQSAIYASDDVKQSLKDNYVSPDAPPLYLNPTFAKISIFPYVTKSGIYHSYEEVWVKINDGRFVLNQRDLKKKRR